MFDGPSSSTASSSSWSDFNVTRRVAHKSGPQLMSLSARCTVSASKFPSPFYYHTKLKDNTTGLVFKSQMIMMMGEPKFNSK